MDRTVARHAPDERLGDLLDACVVHEGVQYLLDLLELELLRPVDEASSFWRVSARGPHATLVKAEAKQWSRLLRERGPDNKQSVDWGRWSHPEVTRAADRGAYHAQAAGVSQPRPMRARLRREMGRRPVWTGHSTFAPGPHARVRCSIETRALKPAKPRWLRGIAPGHVESPPITTTHPASGPSHEGVR